MKEEQKEVQDDVATIPLNEDSAQAPFSTTHLDHCSDTAVDEMGKTEKTPCKEVSAENAKPPNDADAEAKLHTPRKKTIHVRCDVSRDVMDIMTELAATALSKAQENKGEETPEATEATDPATPSQLQCASPSSTCESLLSSPPVASAVCSDEQMPAAVPHQTPEQGLSSEPIRLVQPLDCATEFPTSSQAARPIISAPPPFVPPTYSPSFGLGTPVAIPTALLAEGIGGYDFFDQPLYTPNPKRARLDTTVSFSRAIASEIASESFTFPPNILGHPLRPPSPPPSTVLLPPVMPLKIHANQPLPAPTKEPNSNPQPLFPLFPEEFLPFSSFSRRSRHTPRQCVGTSPDNSTTHHPGTSLTKEHPPNTSPRNNNSSSSSVRSSPRLINRSSASSTTSTPPPHMPASSVSSTPPSPNKRAKTSTPTPPRPTSRLSSSPGSPSSISSYQDSFGSPNGSPILTDNSLSILVPPTKTNKRKPQPKGCAIPLLSPTPDASIPIPENTESIESIESINTLVSHSLNSNQRNPRLHIKLRIPSNTSSSSSSSASSTTSSTPATPISSAQTRIPTRLSQKLALLSKTRKRGSGPAGLPPTSMVTRSSSAGSARPLRLTERLEELRTAKRAPAPKKATTPVKLPAASPFVTPDGKSTPKSTPSSGGGSAKRPPPCSCHQCKSQKTQVVTCSCLKKFCNACLRIHYDEGLYMRETLK